MWPPLLPESPLELILLIVFWAAVVLQLLYFFFIYLKPARRTPSTPSESTPLPPVSIVICARNEEENLMELIPLLMEQDYPKFQVVVVNDNSWDDTADILKAFQVSFPGLHVTHLDEEKQRMQGKKFALTLGIKAAIYDRVLLTDADCRPQSNGWIREMMTHAGDKAVILGYSPYMRKRGMSNAFIRFDARFGGMNYLGMALNGLPYMGVGRNLSYLKEDFFKIGGFKSHMNLVSGDDDLFINRIANRKNTAVVCHPDSHMSSIPRESISAWYNQKRRHLSTAPYYRFIHRFVLMLFPMSFYLMWTSAIVLLLLQTSPLLVIAPLFLRYLSQFIIFRLSSKTLGDSDLNWKAWYLEALWMVLMPVVSVSLLFRKPNAWS